jgi:hypothetical protein
LNENRSYSQHKARYSLLHNSGAPDVRYNPSISIVGSKTAQTELLQTNTVVHEKKPACNFRRAAAIEA